MARTNADAACHDRDLALASTGADHQKRQTEEQKRRGGSTDVHMPVGAARSLRYPSLSRRTLKASGWPLVASQASARTPPR
jgi:hypothetical protein